MLNLNAVHTPPHRRRVETVKRISYRLSSTRRRLARGTAVILALGSLGLAMSGHQIEGLALVSVALLATSLGGAS
jgi:hypothetical protein